MISLLKHAYQDRGKPSICVQCGATAFLSSDSLLCLFLGATVAFGFRTRLARLSPITEVKVADGYWVSYTRAQ